VAKPVEVAVEEEIPAVCDYCQKPDPDYFCAICGYSFHDRCRSSHRDECSLNLRRKFQWVECSVEGCFKASTSFFQCPICERWFCYEHGKQHIEKELDDAEFEVEEE